LKFDFPFNQCFILFKGSSFGKRVVALEISQQRGILRRYLQLLCSMKPIILFFNDLLADVLSLLVIPTFSNINLSDFDGLPIRLVNQKHP